MGSVLGPAFRVRYRHGARWRACLAECGQGDVGDLVPSLVPFRATHVHVQPVAVFGGQTLGPMLVKLPQDVVVGRVGQAKGG